MMHSPKAGLLLLCCLLLPVQMEPTSSATSSSITATNTQTTSTASTPLIITPVEVCDMKCEHGGICRWVNASGTIEKGCFCPADYMGKLCENASVPPLSECTEATCKNGGMCQGSQTAPYCSCSPGVFGRNCERRLRRFLVSVKLTPNKATDESDPMIRNHTISECQNSTCTAIRRAVEEGNNSYLVASFYGCKFASLYALPLSVVDVQLELDYSDAVASRLTEEAVRSHLNIGANYVNSLSHTALNLLHAFTSELNVTAADPCSDGNNDCSHYGNCSVIAPGLYTCTCNSLAMDSSVDPLYPGRKCIFDGLIIFVCFITGIILSLMICLAFGCRRTVWQRFRRHGGDDKMALIGMPSSYQI